MTAPQPPVCGHTPTPWAYETPMGDASPWVVQAGLQAYEWEPIATLGGDDDVPPRSKAQRTITANADHIVRCVNSHDDLLAAAEMAAEILSDMFRTGKAATPVGDEPLPYGAYFIGEGVMPKLCAAIAAARTTDEVRA